MSDKERAKRILGSSLGKDIWFRGNNNYCAIFNIAYRITRSMISFQAIKTYKKCKYLSNLPAESQRALFKSEKYEIKPVGSCLQDFRLNVSIHSSSLYAYYIHSPSQPPWFNQSTYILRTFIIVKILINHLLSSCSSFPHLVSKHSPRLRCLPSLTWDAVFLYSRPDVIFYWEAMWLVRSDRHKIQVLLFSSCNYRTNYTQINIRLEI